LSLPPMHHVQTLSPHTLRIKTWTCTEKSNMSDINNMPKARLASYWYSKLKLKLTKTLRILLANFWYQGQYLLTTTQVNKPTTQKYVLLNNHLTYVHMYITMYVNYIHTCIWILNHSSWFLKLFRLRNHVTTYIISKC
jgi:hypothetical protein